eukprot:Selendium_serpulae@DN5473_c0_g1_i1.p1
MLTGDIPPNQTLYCNNIEHRIHVKDLKACLFDLFTPYGEVLDVVAQKTPPSKCGQAFVVFAHIGAATTALRALQGFDFLGRPLRITYAKKKSDAAFLAGGTLNRAHRKQLQSRLRDKRMAAAPVKDEEAKDDNADVEMADEAAITKPEEDPALAAAAAALKSMHATTLFVENLPDEMTEAAMKMLFRQYPGFLEVRLIAARNVAFVDYEAEQQAETAVSGLSGFMVTPEKSLKISVAEKE